MSLENDSDLVLCSWCNRSKPHRLCLSGTKPKQVFCSEKCFVLSRRASFKRDRANREHVEAGESTTDTVASTPEPSASCDDKPELVSVKTECASQSSEIDSVLISTASTHAFVPQPVPPLIPPLQPAPSFFLNSPFLTPPTITKTVPIFIPLPIPIPLPIFKNAPELLSILARHGYRPRNNTHRHHHNRRHRHRLQVNSNLKSTSSSQTSTVFEPQENALDLRVSSVSEEINASPTSLAPMPAEVPARLELDQPSHYSARRRRILDVSPVTPVPDKVGYVDRYRAASAIRLKRLRKSKELRAISSAKSRT